MQEFQFNLIDNLLSLHRDLYAKTYQHGLYQAFNIADPKPRHIHKATVRDRVLHHAVYRQLNSFFNHRILLDILAGYISDKNILWLLEKIIHSFYAGCPDKGLPLGNLTSQLFCNIYMNEFDQFVKHKLKAKYYIRYTDDFVLLSEDRKWLCQQIPRIGGFLENRLKLTLHPDKVFIKTLSSGVDFLGWIHFPNHRILRTTTKKRMMRRIREYPAEETVQSYLGLLSHGNTNILRESILQRYLDY